MTQSRRRYRLSELAERFSLERSNGADTIIEGVGTLGGGGASDISFLANRSYAGTLPKTRAGAVILKASDTGNCPTEYLIADDPYLAFARIAALFDPRPAPSPGIHASAVVSESANLGEGVSIGANAVVGDG